MGAIQNSINGALGAVAVAGRMISSEKTDALVQGAAAKEQSVETDKEAIKTAAEVDSKQLELENAEAMEKGYNEAANNVFANPNATPKERLSAAMDANDAMDDRLAAQVALGELFKKQTAIRERQARQKDAIERGRRWGGKY